MIVIFDLKSSKLILEISLPSKMICPSKASKILRRDIMIVDFPLPVRPTTPILWPPLKVTDNPLKTKSRFGLYLTL